MSRMHAAGFAPGKRAPTSFRHQTCDFRCVDYGDGCLHLCGEGGGFGVGGRAWYDTKARGPEDGGRGEMVILNRRLSWQDRGVQSLEFRAVPRHAEETVKGMGMMYRRKK